MSESGVAEESGLFQSLSLSPLAILNRLSAYGQPTKPAFCARPARRPGIHNADCNSLYEQITDKIITELEQGRVPWVQPWGNVKAPFGLPKNAATGRAYSGVNVLIL